MRRLQRAGELVGHADGLRLRERTLRQPIGEGAALHQPHDEIGRVRFAPEVVQRHDVRVFEPSDESCLGLESADETRVVRELRTDDLDRHLTTDRRLIRPIGNPEFAGADLLAQLVATHGQAR